MRSFIPAPTSFKPDLQFAFITNANSTKPLLEVSLDFGICPSPGRGLCSPASCPVCAPGSAELTTAASAQQSQNHFLQAPCTGRWTKAALTNIRANLTPLQVWTWGRGSPKHHCVSGCDHPLWSVTTLELSRKLSVRPWAPAPPGQVFWFEKSVGTTRASTASSSRKHRSNFL